MSLFNNAEDQQPVVRQEWVVNAGQLRNALLHDLLSLGPGARLRDTLVREPVLEKLPGVPLSDFKVRSLTKKYKTIPQKYLDYYPDVDDDSQAEDEPEAAGGAPAAATPDPQPPCRPVGRPPKVRPVPQGSQSLLQMWTQ